MCGFVFYLSFYSDENTWGLLKLHNPTYSLYFLFFFVDSLFFCILFKTNFSLQTISVNMDYKNSVNFKCIGIQCVIYLFFYIFRNLFSKNVNLKYFIHKHFHILCQNTVYN